jgi:hypothetical protein
MFVIFGLQIYFNFNGIPAILFYNYLAEINLRFQQVQTGSNRFKQVITGSNRFKQVQTGSNSFIFSEIINKIG